MKIYGWKILSTIAAVSLLLSVAPVQAALIGVTPTQPDVTTNNTTTTNDWTKAKGNTPAFGVLTVTGAFTGNASPGNYLDANLGLDENIIVLYSLTLNYDGNYSLTSGDVSIDLRGDSAPVTGVANPGENIMTADLTGFGFSGSGASGVMDYTFDLTGGAWYNMGYSSISSGIINNISNISSAPGGAWTAANLFGQDWSATGGLNNTNTFVPVPPTVWLFLSGLFGLAGISFRRSNKR